MTSKLTRDQLQSLTDEMNEFMETSGRKRFPVDKADELATYGAKRCGKCTAVKLVEAFPKDSHRRDGLNGHCKECHLSITTAHYHRNPEHFRDYRAANRERINEYAREYREQNRDQLNEYYREYRHTRYHNEELYRLRCLLDSGYRRAVASGVQADWITAEQLLTYWAAKGIDPLRCYLTGAELSPFDRSLDHVLAISNGGTHTVDNLMPVTVEANKRKHNMSPDEAKEKLSND